MTLPQRLLNIVLLPLIVLVAVFIVKNMIANKPERTIKKPQVVISSVSFITSTPQDITPILNSYGNTRSYYQAQLSAQIGGEILKISPKFNSGQSVKKGELLVEIDPADTLAIIAQQQAQLANSEQALLEEQIRSKLAAQDWIESGRDLKDATDLTLRKPQLGAAKANVASAKAGLQKANLDLARTKIRAPFDALVQNRSASPGNVVNSGSILGALVAKEKAEVRLSLAPQQVNRLLLPMEGHESELTAVLTSPNQPDAEWNARITRTEPSVDQQNQVIYVVGEIDQPFENPQAFLPIGAFVKARIPASIIKQAHRIPNTALVEDAYVWTIDEDRTLNKTPATRIIADGDSVIVRFAPDLNTKSVQIAIRPLASFKIDQSVEPIAH